MRRPRRQEVLMRYRNWKRIQQIGNPELLQMFMKLDPQTDERLRKDCPECFMERPEPESFALDQVRRLVADQLERDGGGLLDRSANTAHAMFQVARSLQIACVEPRRSDQPRRSILAHTIVMTVSDESMRWFESKSTVFPLDVELVWLGYGEGTQGDIYVIGHCLGGAEGTVLYPVQHFNLEDINV